MHHVQSSLLTLNSDIYISSWLHAALNSYFKWFSCSVMIARKKDIAYFFINFYICGCVWDQIDILYCRSLGILSYKMGGGGGSPLFTCALSDQCNDKFLFFPLLVQNAPPAIKLFKSFVSLTSWLLFDLFFRDINANVKIFRDPAQDLQI